MGEAFSLDRRKDFHGTVWGGELLLGGVGQFGVLDDHRARRLVMSGLDVWLAGLGGPGALGLAVALLLGLRHASDPDHLTAVSTLLLSDERAGARRAGLMGRGGGAGPLRGRHGRVDGDGILRLGVCDGQG